ncbi:hypothetical protein I3843_03G049000 [Carya illinoinensis]|nr:uncharacterized protein LOC122302728 isoform X1 [Carya illinoinensis]XP_042970062.1 uncharacterized protein LOC122302728 isoform X1 [Carya illinoinensis]KAG7985864.1 hypothetical protein I3843_03G049000 [Carya illinoinensis]KAG7985865.1 hypothetical protein I3843_03G049000 [Carya illinoinensis]KAG7985866.1 hypothetical protein I3843_03G049000 [Carya illinoinensis]KAG7985867.1 hypothetical protein I3843_03G049000 [Carya illinoinensis]
MVLGLKAKNRRSASVQINYLIHVEDIKPWPPSQSLRSLRSVLIQWENGDRNSGSTNIVVPSLGSVVVEGKIEFNESFRLPVTLLRDISVKGGDADAFKKNCLEFNLYEARRDKTVKGQSLATAIIDLADYGVVQDALSISAPMNCKRSYGNTDQPILNIKIQPVRKGRTNSSLRDNQSRRVSQNDNGGGSVSALMNEEYAEEAESASFTDDDVSSHSSQTIASTAFDSIGGLPPQENGADTVRHSTGGGNKDHALAANLKFEQSNMTSCIGSQENPKGSSSCSSSIDLSSDLGSPVNGPASESNFPNSSSTSIQQHVASHGFHSSSSSLVYENTEEDSDIRSNDNGHLALEVHEKISNTTSVVSGDGERNIKENVLHSFVASPDKNSQMVEKLDSSKYSDSKVNGNNDGKGWEIGSDHLEEAETTDDYFDGSMEDKYGKEPQEKGLEIENLDEKTLFTEDEPSVTGSATRGQASLEGDTFSLSSGSPGLKSNILKSERLKNVKSVRSSTDLGRTNGLVSGTQHTEVTEAGVLGDAQYIGRNLRSNERKDAKVYPKDTKSALLDSKIQQLEYRIKMLEGELREAAAVEASLYSVVAEHGSSMSKVHAPARRLSRLYLHACRESSLSRKASAARSAVSGLFLVAKACGNDVPRLTFWLSNSIVLRTIISKAIGDRELPLPAEFGIERNGGVKVINKVSSLLKWKVSSPGIKENAKSLYGSFGNWEDPRTFTSALEKIESWIFSRIVESIWWQTLTPHMHSTAATTINECLGSSSRKTYERLSSSGEQEQGNFAIDLWKKAFRDACERLCPIRAGGHECGCLPLLARLIMEQCVARLDVAMFNAILRESADEIPTDPVSDPISDAKVLPISAGKSSFGAGAQLKNAIGNWSRWLTDLFGMDDDDSIDDANNHDDTDEREDASFKSFHLLNALSDLMMLPKDMLLSKTIRKEVCPSFGAPLIKRVVGNFVPDEFCPDPIPRVVLEALDSEDHFEPGEESLMNFPCAAAPTVYSPPLAASVANIIGETGSQTHLRRSGSSVLRKSYTSDDELDELNSPLSSIFIDGSLSSAVPTKFSWVSKGNGNQDAVRYELLRSVWMNSD